MGVVSSLDAVSSLAGRKLSPDADPKGKKSKNKMLEYDGLKIRLALKGLHCNSYNAILTGEISTCKILCWRY